MRRMSVVLGRMVSVLLLIVGASLVGRAVLIGVGLALVPGSLIRQLSSVAVPLLAGLVMGGAGWLLAGVTGPGRRPVG